MQRGTDWRPACQALPCPAAVPPPRTRHQQLPTFGERGMQLRPADLPLCVEPGLLRRQQRMHSSAGYDAPVPQPAMGHEAEPSS